MIGQLLSPVKGACTVTLLSLFSHRFSTRPGGFISGTLLFVVFPHPSLEKWPLDLFVLLWYRPEPEPQIQSVLFLHMAGPGGSIPSTLYGHQRS